MAAFELRQQMKLSQQLIMTPQLQQAIKLLQLSRLELLETINQEIEENPTLEDDQEEIAMGEEQEHQEASSSEEVYEDVEIKENIREDFDWEGYLDEYSSGSPVLVERDPNQEQSSYDHRLTPSTTLQDHLTWQLRFSNMTDWEKEVGTFILGNLNMSGYLDATTQEISEMAQVSEDEVKNVLMKIQQFDPVGVASRNPKECLLIQARKLHPENELVLQIIEHHLHDLENKNYQALVRVLKSSPRDIKGAIDIILTLDPRPGSAYNIESVEYVNPDIYILKVDGEFVVVLNEDGMPKLRVSPYYKDALTQDAPLSPEAKDYIQNKLRSAAWLIKSVHQRQRTIYRVSESIVKLQREFFERGVAHLKPMVLRDVAEDVSMHESTISRVTSNKYIHTPHGIFELKYFFNSSINSVYGEAVASESVKERIRHIIKEEPPKKPFSDKDIVWMLEKENIKVARRTVAKYREMMGILPSSKRKKASWGT